MKRLVFITGVVVYVLFAVSSVIAVSVENRSNILEEYPTQSQEIIQDDEYQYIIKELDGVIAVIDIQGNIITKTDTQVSLLPEDDRTQLKQGIAIKTDTQLRKLLEDYCS